MDAAAATAFLQQNPNFALRLDTVPEPLRTSLFRRLASMLKSIRNNHTFVKSDMNYPSSAITNDAEIKEDIDNAIFLYHNPYHIAGSCETNFEDLVNRLTSILAANDDNAYAVAIGQVDMCRAGRVLMDTRRPTNPDDHAHASNIAFLSLLRDELNAARGSLPGNRKQVTLYQYVTKSGETKCAQAKADALARGVVLTDTNAINGLKTGKTVYDFVVEDLSAQGTIMTARPFNPDGSGGEEARADEYDARREGRIAALRTEYETVERPNNRVIEQARRARERASVLAAPGGRRTRRRRAFKRRPKQSRKRMSRRA